MGSIGVGREIKRHLVSDNDENDAGCFLDLRAEFSSQNEEPSSYITEFTGNIMAGIELTDVAGKLTLFVVQLEAAFDAGTSLEDVLDCYDSDMAEFCVIVNHSGFPRSIEKIAGTDVCPLLILQHMTIEPEFRGRGIGLEAIKIACQTVGLGCGLAALFAFPTQWNGKAETDPKNFGRDRAKLLKYYARLGFVKTRFPGIMVKRLP